MSAVQPDRSPFAQLDQMPPPMRAMLIRTLDAMAVEPQIRRVRAAALDALMPIPGQRLLDVGCGGGEVARELAALTAPGGQVTAVDIAAAVVEVARSRHDGSSVSYAVGDVRRLEFPDNTFDGVRTERVLQHLDDPDAAVGELARVTRPGGRVCLIDTDWESLAFDGLPPEIVAAMKQAVMGDSVVHHADMGRTLRRRLVRAGLREVTCEPVPLWWTNPEEASAVIPLVNKQIPPEAGIIPAELRQQWFAKVDAAVARGEFLTVLTIWVAAGVAP